MPDVDVEKCLVEDEQSSDCRVSFVLVRATVELTERRSPHYVVPTHSFVMEKFKCRDRPEGGRPSNIVNNYIA